MGDPGVSKIQRMSFVRWYLNQMFPGEFVMDNEKARKWELVIDEIHESM